MGGWQSGLLALLFLLTTPTWATEESASCRPAHTKVSKIVLIIDDIGHRFDTGMAAVALPGKLNLAVLPYTPHAHNLASAAFDAGKEVMLHVPMSAMDGRPLGPGGLSTGLSEEDFRQTLVAALEEVPSDAPADGVGHGGTARARALFRGLTHHRTYRGRTHGSPL
jgi:polysaccharide deacetylase 2 family uncharacterized protein YibQ